MFKSLILLAVLACLTKQIYSTNTRVEAMKAFKTLTMPDVYDKDIRPKLGEDEPVQVNITMYVINYTFKPDKREMSANLYFRQIWNDPRLVMTGTDKVVGGQSLVSRVWIPDTFFANSIEIEAFKYPTRNSFLMVQPNGTVLYSERLLIEFKCGQAMTNTKTDSCDLEMESYGFSMTDMKYGWGKGAASLKYSPSSTRNQYKLTAAEVKSSQETLSSGNYSRLSAHFKFNCDECMDNEIVDTMTTTTTTTTTMTPIAGL